MVADNLASGVLEPGKIFYGRRSGASEDDPDNRAFLYLQSLSSGLDHSSQSRYSYFSGTSISLDRSASITRIQGGKMTCITHVLCSLAMVFSEYSERSIIGCLYWSNTSEANFRVAFRPFLLFMGLRSELYVCKDGVTIVLALFDG